MTDTLIEFPADIAVKAMGLSAADFETLISSLVLPHIEPEPVPAPLCPEKPQHRVPADENGSSPDRGFAASRGRLKPANRDMHFAISF